MIPINYAAVITATLVSIILGFLWYGPLFGKPWMRYMGISEDKEKKMKKQSMVGTYALMTIGSFLTAYVFTYSTTFAMSYTETYGTNAGLMSGFWTWLGFMMPLQLGTVLWEEKPWGLFFINTGYYLFSMLVMGVVITSWM